MANLTSSLALLANQCVQNTNEHIANNLQPVFCRMIFVHIRREFPLLDDTELIIKKLSLHTYKRLGRMLTIWPTSVPRTVARNQVVEQLIAHYLPWFQGLEEAAVPPMFDEEMEAGEIDELAAEQAEFDDAEFLPEQEEEDDENDDDAEFQPDDNDDEEDQEFFPEAGDDEGLAAYPNVIKRVSATD